MRLLIDATTAQHARGGIGVVAQGLLGALQGRDDVEATILAGPYTDVGSLPSWHPPLVARTPARIAFQRVALPAVTAIGGRWLGHPQRVLLLDSYVPMWRVPRQPAQLATFVHDVLPLTHPEYFARRKDVAKRLAFDAIRRQRPLVFTSCEFTAAEIRRELGVDPVVAEFGCGQLRDEEADELLASRPTERARYFLYVGALEARKDLRTLVQGFARLAAKEEGVRLAFVGNWRTDEGRAFRKWAETVGGSGVRFLGKRSSDEVFELMRRACAVVYPSLAEGFGLPVLEAMATGTPVISTDIPVIRSWALDGPLYFTAGDSESLEATLAEALRAASSARIARGKDIAERFRWSRFADRLLAA